MLRICLLLLLLAACGPLNVPDAGTPRWCIGVACAPGDVCNPASGFCDHPDGGH